MTSTEVAGEAVPASQRGSWTSFLKSIASFSGDLSSLTAPPFILSPVSLTEFPAYWCEHPDIFAAIADAKDDESRALAVLRWFISTLKGQYTSRNESMGSEKKPLNPVLGELFYGQWPPSGTASAQGTTTLLVEQVSHHPPITAYVIENKSKGLRLSGHNAQKTSFSAGSIIVKQIGHAILTVSLPNTTTKVEYLITLPRLRIDGLWYGSPYIELTDTSYIVGGGFVSTIEFKGKGYFSGKSHVFKAVVSPIPSVSNNNNSNNNNNTTSSHSSSYFSSSSSSSSSSSNNNNINNTTTTTTTSSEHTIEGTWHTTSRFTAGKYRSKTTLFHDVSYGDEGGGTRKVEVTPVGGNHDGGMGEFETRRLWRDVARGIKEGDFEVASREKGRIENEARQRRKDEEAAGTAWALKHFVRVESDPVYERLGKLIKISPPTEDTYVFQDNLPVTLGSAASASSASV